MNVVINRCFGGFGLSFDACKRYLELAGKECVFYKGGYKDKKTKVEKPNDDDWDIIISTKDLGDVIDDVPNEFFWYSGKIGDRSDQTLVTVVEEMKDKANSRFANLQVVSIPDDVSYEIDEYDGMESIHETHRCWY